MRFIKKLFAKKLAQDLKTESDLNKPKKNSLEKFILKFPFDIAKVPNKDNYIKALVNVTVFENETDSLTDAQLLLEFGKLKTRHIINIYMTDVYILMSPKDNDWEAIRVFLANFEGAEKTAKKQKMTFLFKYPNPEYGQDNAYYEDVLKPTAEVMVYAISNQKPES